MLSQEAGAKVRCVCKTRLIIPIMLEVPREVKMQDEAVEGRSISCKRPPQPGRHLNRQLVKKEVGTEGDWMEEPQDLFWLREKEDSLVGAAGRDEQEAKGGSAHRNKAEEETEAERTDDGRQGATNEAKAAEREELERRREASEERKEQQEMLRARLDREREREEGKGGREERAKGDKERTSEGC